MQEAENPNAESVPGGQAVTGERQELRYRFECDTVDEFGAIYAPDVSRGGIFIRAQQMLPLATPVKLELLLADETVFITAEGLVFWTRAASEQGSTQGEPGMGIRFTRMSQESHRNLTRILAVKQAEDWIREAEAEADADDQGGEIQDEHTAVASAHDLRAAFAKAAVAEASAPATTVAAGAAVTEVVALEMVASETARTETTTPVPSEPSLTEPAAAPLATPAAAPRSLPHPVPALPDWAFVSTRFGAESTAPSEKAAVPHYIPDVRDTSFGAPGSVATRSVSVTAATTSAPAPKSTAPQVASGRSLKNHVGLRLVVGAALVLVTALALAPSQKGHKATSPARVRAVAAPARAVHATQPPPVVYGPALAPPDAPSSERVVSSR